MSGEIIVTEDRIELQSRCCEEIVEAIRKKAREAVSSGISLGKRKSNERKLAKASQKAGVEMLRSKLRDMENKNYSSKVDEIMKREGLK